MLFSVIYRGLACVLDRVADRAAERRGADGEAGGLLLAVSAQSVSGPVQEPVSPAGDLVFGDR